MCPLKLGADTNLSDKLFMSDRPYRCGESDQHNFRPLFAIPVLKNCFPVLLGHRPELHGQTWLASLSPYKESRER